jgi:hypothetical protein
MLRSTLTTTALMLMTITGPALAAEKDALAPATLATATSVAAPIAIPHFETPRRPVALPSLYVSFAALQIVDARTTMGVLRRGASEANPLLSQPNQMGVWAVKAASTASTIYFVERIWKKNRVAAVLVMAGINGGYAAIAAHNTKQAR